MKKKEAVAKAPNLIDDAVARMHATIDRASAVAAPALERAGSRAHQATDQLGAVAEATAAQLKSKGQALREAQSRLVTKSRAQIQEKPFTMFGIGVAAGVLLSWLLRQRSAHHPRPE